MNTDTITENEVLSLIIRYESLKIVDLFLFLTNSEHVSQLVAYGYSGVAQNVADATGASTDMMPSLKLSELLQIAKDKSNSYRKTVYMQYLNVL